MPTNVSDSLGLLSLDIADDLAPPGGAMDGLLEAYRQQGYEAGYHRALNDVLADFLMFAQRLVRDSSSDDRAPLRSTLRQFEMQLESSLADRSARVEVFVEGGLGI